jgi:hypothetical protein
VALRRDKMSAGKVAMEGHKAGFAVPAKAAELSEVLSSDDAAEGNVSARPGGGEPVDAGGRQAAD